MTFSKQTLWMSQAPSFNDDGRFVQCYNCENLTENWEILEGPNPVDQLCDNCLKEGHIPFQCS